METLLNILQIVYLHTCGVYLCSQDILWLLLWLLWLLFYGQYAPTLILQTCVYVCVWGGLDFGVYSMELSAPELWVRSVQLEVCGTDKTLLSSSGRGEDGWGQRIFHCCLSLKPHFTFIHSADALCKADYGKLSEVECTQQLRGNTNVWGKTLWSNVSQMSNEMSKCFECFVELLH